MSDNCPLVSVVSPCYNSELYIERMLRSVLSQTYPNVELICVDDGSTDNTVSVIENYKTLFEEKGYTLLCIRTIHRGQAAAVNAGLKHVNGEYLTLLDSDDFFVNSSIEKRVGALISHPECAVVTSDYYVVNENDIGKVVERGNSYIGDLAYQPYQFRLAVIGYSSISAGTYLIRMEDFKRINPLLEINECSEGQNYQILLPLYYHYKRCFLKEPLSYYVIRLDSHAHSTTDNSERNKRLIVMLREVLTDLGIGEADIDLYVRMSSFSKPLGGK